MDRGSDDLVEFFFSADGTGVDHDREFRAGSGEAAREHGLPVRSDQVRLAVVPFGLPRKNLRVRDLGALCRDSLGDCICQFLQICVSVKVVAADCRVVLNVVLRDPAHRRAERRPAIADVRPSHGRCAIAERLREVIHSAPGQGADPDHTCLRTVAFQPARELFFLLWIQKVALIQDEKIRLRELGLQNIFEVAAPPVAKLPCRLRLDKDREGRQLVPPRILL